MGNIDHNTPSSFPAHLAYDDILVTALLAQHGGRDRLPLLGDEELHRARLAIWREHVTAGDWFGDIANPIQAISRVLALGEARRIIEDEESRRERARLVYQVPRDHPSGWVPDDVVDAIRERLSPTDLFHRYGLTELRAIGRGKWLGRCPFHEDSSPSLYVYTIDARDQHWHCFGCLAHGDVFDLARRHFGLGFAEVCEGLASLAGVAWPPAPAPPPVVPSFGERAVRVAHGG